MFTVGNLASNLHLEHEFDASFLSDIIIFDKYFYNLFFGILLSKIIEEKVIRWEAFNGSGQSLLGMSGNKKKKHE